jgi:predicted Zn-dependent protease
MSRATIAALVLTACAAPAAAQFPGADKVIKGATLLSDLSISAEQEREIGATVSQRIRERYGVVQDKAVHRYVALVGHALAQSSEKPALAWQFIVLDTDGVNAFAAPGGFIHVTRGALGLMKNEAELAGVLAHELIHVTEQHTIDAIKKGKLTEFGIDEGAARAPGGGLSQLAISAFADKATELVLAGFGRGEEIESDTKGIALANKVGYAPTGLSAFLTRLEERNAGATQKQGLFASHPEMKERLDRLGKQVKSQKLAASATLEDRFAKHVSYTTPAQAEIATVEAGASGLTGGSGTAKGGSASTASSGSAAAPPAEQKPKKSGLMGLSAKSFGGGDDKKSAQVTGSGGSRGVDKERDAKGGPNPALVAVKIAPAEVAQFKQEGQLQ